MSAMWGDLRKRLRSSRLLAFLSRVLLLSAVMFVVWRVSAAVLPQGMLRPFFSGRFSTVVGEFTFWKVFLPNLLVGFLGVQFMNLFRVGKRPGGSYVLPVFWVLYGLLLGTNSFVFAGQPVPLSVSVLWTRTGFSELLAYTLGYEASRQWSVWEQATLWAAPRRMAGKWKPRAGDAAYWVMGLLWLVWAVAREVH